MAGTDAFIEDRCRSQVCGGILGLPVSRRSHRVHQTLGAYLGCDKPPRAARHRHPRFLHSSSVPPLQEIQEHGQAVRLTRAGFRCSTRLHGESREVDGRGNWDLQALPRADFEFKYLLHLTCTFAAGAQFDLIKAESVTSRGDQVARFLA